MRRLFITAQLSYYAFTPKSWNRNSAVVTAIDRQRCECATRALDIAIAQCSADPSKRQVLRFAGILGNKCLDCRDQRMRIAMPVEFNLCAGSLQRCIFGSHSDCAVVYTLFIGITAQRIIGKSELLQDGRILRVELNSALKIFDRLIPAPLASIDITNQHKHPRVVRQTVLCQTKFAPSAIVIEITPVQMFGESKVCFTGIWK